MLEKARWTRCLTTADLERSTLLYRQVASLQKEILRPAIAEFLRRRSKPAENGPLQSVILLQSPRPGWTAEEYFEKLDRQLDVRILTRLIRDLPFTGDRAGFTLVTETPRKRVKGTWSLVRLFEGGSYGGSFDSLAEFDYAWKTRTTSTP